MCLNFGAIGTPVALLSGELPSEIGLTPMLETLLLGDNHILRGTLSGSVPEELGTASDLIDLNIAGTEITGSIPEELCRRMAGRRAKHE